MPIQHRPNANCHPITWWESRCNASARVMAPRGFSRPWQTAQSLVHITHNVVKMHTMPHALTAFLQQLDRHQLADALAACCGRIYSTPLHDELSGLPAEPPEGVLLCRHQERLSSSTK